MILRSVILSLSIVLCLYGSDALDRAHKFEEAGDSIAAREAFSKAVQQTPNDTELLTGYAEFLERYHDPAARATYRRVSTLWKQAGKTADAASAARRAILLDLIAGDRKSADEDLAVYKALGGADLQLASAEKPLLQAGKLVTIPGPLRSFARMAAFSADTVPEDVMPALARNVVTNGYQASRSNEELEETEYLKLVHRYLGAGARTR